MYKIPLLIVSLLSACAFNSSLKPETEAINSGMQLIEIPSNGFVLSSFQRINHNNSPIRIYIEGDGFAWITRTEPSDDPTPKNALALKLALKDTASNVVYLARPCQYSLAKSPKCNVNKWTDERFSSEMMHVMSLGLDSIKSAHPRQSFELIAYSGGATIALMLAAQRHDIISLRTVAGNLSPKLVNKHHKVSAMNNAVDPIEISNKIAFIPQIHFYGTDDKIVPQWIAETYLKSIKDKRCAQMIAVEKTSHEDGWVEAWPRLLNQPINCLAASIAESNK
jgi:hypothetical protein